SASTDKDIPRVVFDANRFMDERASKGYVYSAHPLPPLHTTVSNGVNSTESSKTDMERQQSQAAITEPKSKRRKLQGDPSPPKLRLAVENLGQRETGNVVMKVSTAPANFNDGTSPSPSTKRVRFEMIGNMRFYSNGCSYESESTANRRAHMIDVHECRMSHKTLNVVTGHV
ncbi:unnamed protein product, partial [Allacma fusca]